MNARDRYWYAFAEMLYRKYYLESYKQKAVLIDQSLSGFLILTSSSGIAAWSIWKQHTYVWAMLIALAQIIGLIKPLFHFQEQVISINYCLPDLETILVEMEKTWQSIDSISNTEIIKRHTKFENQYKSLAGKYLSSLRDNKRCQNIAMDKRDAYLLPYTKGSKNEVKI